MSQKEEKPCIQKRIKTWLYNLIRERVSLFLIAFSLLFWVLGEFVSFLTEFSAGVLGIYLGLLVDRKREEWKKRRITNQIIGNLLVELYTNLTLVTELNSEIKIEPHAPSGTSFIGDVFDLFQTSAWDMFSPRMELDSIDILFDLGIIYHKFKLFNEGMKIEGMGGQLSDYLRKNPKFFEQLKKDIRIIIGALESLAD